ncbi:MAG: hypothetical protein ABH833_03800 [Parcubacteria group bacterium]
MSKEVIKIKESKKVDTKGVDGKLNGFVLEVLSEDDGFAEGLKGQVYLTVAGARVQKGYHIHALATYHVSCIKGKMKSTVYYSKNEKKEIEMGDGNFKVIKYPPGCAHLITNIGDEDAYVIIYRDIPWDPEVKEQLDIAPEDIETEEAWKKIKEFNKSFKDE